MTSTRLEDQLLLIVLDRTTHCAPRYVLWENTVVLGSTMTALSLLPQPISLLA